MNPLKDPENFVEHMPDVMTFSVPCFTFKLLTLKIPERTLTF